MYESLLDDKIFLLMRRTCCKQYSIYPAINSSKVLKFLSWYSSQPTWRGATMSEFCPDAWLSLWSSAAATVFKDYLRLDSTATNFASKLTFQVNTSMAPKTLKCYSQNYNEPGSGLDCFVRCWLKFYIFIFINRLIHTSHFASFFCICWDFMCRAQNLGRIFSI